MLVLFFQRYILKRRDKKDLTPYFRKKMENVFCFLAGGNFFDRCDFFFEVQRLSVPFVQTNSLTRLKRKICWSSNYL